MKAPVIIAALLCAASCSSTDARSDTNTASGPTAMATQLVTAAAGTGQGDSDDERNDNELSPRELAYLHRVHHVPEAAPAPPTDEFEEPVEAVGELGAAFCPVAANSADLDEYVRTIQLTLALNRNPLQQRGLSPDEAVQAGTIAATFMCQDAIDSLTPSE